MQNCRQADSGDGEANGKPAGQTVFHFHIHLVPRHEDDGMALTWPVKNPPRERLEEYAAKIRGSQAFQGE